MKEISICCVFLLSLILVGCFTTGTTTAPRAGRDSAECRRASSPPVIDGRPDDPAWRSASVFPLRKSWEKRPAASATRARLLWDDAAVYFLAEMEDEDVFADIAEQDGRLYLNDVFELFFKPAANRPGYYEFEVNAANAHLDMYLPSRDSGGYAAHKSDRPFHMQTRVAVHGTLNRRGDRDRGWTVEGRIPWSDFAPTGGRPSAGDVWKFALCRYDYTQGRPEPELSASAPLSERNFHRHEEYGRLRFAAE